MTDNEIVLAVLALAAILVSLRQSHTDARRLRFELFERRFAMMREIAAFLASILTRDRINRDLEARYHEATRGARFLFDETVQDLLEEIHQQAARFHALVTMRDAALEAGGPVAEAEALKEQAVRDWISATLDGLDARFAPFLRLEPRWRTWIRRLR